MSRRGNVTAGRAVVLACVLAACQPESRSDPEAPFEEGTIGAWRAALDVGDAGGCSTAVVEGLARQLIDEINCLRPDTLTSFRGDGVRLGEAAWPFLQAAASRALRAAVEARGGTLPVTSGLRTLPQQFLLYRWYRQGRCGISLAASPGRSPHESGLAIDTSEAAAWRPALEARGWDWHGADDPVHFDFEGGGTVNLSGLSVRAFQRLWNRNHPEDRIDEDGAYGPQTEARLTRSPTGGFPIGGCEAEPPPPPPPPPPPQDLALAVVSRWVTIEGQARDLVSEGSSAGVFDVLTGQRFQAAIEVRSGADRAPADGLVVGYAFDAPWLRAESLVVEVQRGEDVWEALGPAVPAPAAEGRVEVGTTPGGETRRVRFDLVAEASRHGEAHAALRGWVVHIANVYGEQDAWDDAVEHNDVGEVLRHAGELDVFARDDWRFLGGRPEDAQGFRGCDGGAVRVDPGFDALVSDAGCVESPAWTWIDADAAGGLRVELRGEATSGRVLWRADGDAFAEERAADFELRGDGEPEAVQLDLRGRPGFSGVLAGLRVEADGALALTRLGALAVEDLPRPTGPDAGVPDAGGVPDGAVPSEPDAGAADDPDAAVADEPDGGSPPPTRRILDVRYQGGCDAAGGAGVFAGLALLPLALGRRRRHPRPTR